MQLASTWRTCGNVADDEVDDVMVPILPCNILSDEQLDSSGSLHDRSNIYVSNIVRETFIGQ